MFGIRNEFCSTPFGINYSLVFRERTYLCIQLRAARLRCDAQLSFASRGRRYLSRLKRNDDSDDERYDRERGDGHNHHTSP